MRTVRGDRTDAVLGLVFLSLFWIKAHSKGNGHYTFVWEGRCSVVVTYELT